MCLSEQKRLNSGRGERKIFLAAVDGSVIEARWH
jgi:hypothetical protein